MGKMVNYDVDPEYKILVELAAEKELNTDIPNSSKNHALYIIKRIIEKTEKRLIIYLTGNPNEPFFDDSIKKAIECRKEDIKDLKVRLINKNRTSEFFDSIEIKPVYGAIPIGFQFIVSDGKRIRISSERDCEQGIVNFNNPEIASILENRFNSK
ncbi:MAG: hypothetical protein KJ955_07230 [Nanoarchaeota archaeon]|nr:hypothetical protein [Nanoarchaeota archaeon]